MGRMLAIIAAIFSLLKSPSEPPSASGPWSCSSAIETLHSTTSYESSLKLPAPKWMQEPAAKHFAQQYSDGDFSASCCRARHKTNELF